MRYFIRTWMNCLCYKFMNERMITLSIKGGYKYIDFTGCTFVKDDVTSTETANVYKSTKVGIYDSLEATYGKALRLGGLVINGQDIDEQEVFRTIGAGGNILFTFNIQSTALKTALTPSAKTFVSAAVSVSSDDTITITITGE